MLQPDLAHDQGMKKVLLASSLALFANALCAQTVSVQATGTLFLSAVGSGQPVTQTQPVVNSTTLQSAGVGNIVLSTGVTTTLSTTAASPPWPGPTMGWYSLASVDVTLRYSATAPVAGVLRLTVNPSCVMVAPPYVDVGDDGLYEVPPSGAASVVDVPVVLGPRPIVVRVYDQVVNFGATCASSMSVEFLPQPANLDTNGIACGPSLAAALLRPTTTSGRLWLHVDDAVVPASLAAAIVFGSTPVPMGPSCGPGLVGDGWVLVTPTPGGFDLPVPLSTGLLGSVQLQHVGLQLPFSLLWSNRVGLTLP